MADVLIATKVIDASADAIFAVLTDPTSHAAIDGTGWVREAIDGVPLTATGQIFGMEMFHPARADGHYKMFNRVQAFDPPKTVSWEPGYDAGDGNLGYGGWIWRYDLAAAGPTSTEVTLTYDWSAVPDTLREHIGFPPFPPEHLDNSLAHLAQLISS
jgi:hypothetical protein